MKHTSRLFIALFVFFIVVALGALYMLSGTGSVFNRDKNTPGSETAVMSQTILGDEAVMGVSWNDDFADDGFDEASQEDSSGDSTEAADMDAAGGDSASDSEDLAAKNTREIRYFTFVTGTKYTILRLRAEPSEDGEILAKLNKKTPGYSIQPGNEWSKVVMPTGTVGYCATKYLKITEVTKQEYPAEFVDMVEAPVEDLNF